MNQGLGVMEKIVSLCKRRGFIFPGSEIYGGLAGAYDYGPLGVLLKNNIKRLWWETFMLKRNDIFGFDSAILMNPNVWKTSGHVEHFTDQLTDTKKFNTMFKTSVGATEDTALDIYLRPETAQGMFVNFKNIVDAFHPQLPFGIAQIGKAFRNEIAPRDFLFRVREFEQMEIEYFVRPPAGGQWEEQFEIWRKATRAWIEAIGIASDHIVEHDVPSEERAHYSKRTIDFMYPYPFGAGELYGLAYRTDFDLKTHGLSYYDEETKETFVPHVIEPSFGLDRLVLALFCEVYTEDDPPAGGGEEKRVMLKLNPKIAPVKIAVFPLLANKPDLITKAKEVYKILQPTTYNLQAPIAWDDNGNIGKRYRRQDEIGTPWCVTIDFQTLDDDTVTIRDRDTGSQTRYAIAELEQYFVSALS
jgi:glycyl-tRNA synthetase